MDNGDKQSDFDRRLNLVESLNRSWKMIESYSYTSHPKCLLSSVLEPIPIPWTEISHFRTGSKKKFFLEPWQRITASVAVFLENLFPGKSGNGCLLQS